MAKVSTATSCMAVVKFMQNTQTRRKNMLPTPTKAEMKQRSAIASDPIIIQEFKDPILSFEGAKVNFKIHGKFKGRLSPTFDREKLRFAFEEAMAAVSLENRTTSLEQNMTEKSCSPSLKTTGARELRNQALLLKEAATACDTPRNVSWKEIICGLKSAYKDCFVPSQVMTYNSSLYISLKLHEDRELATLGVGGGGFEKTRGRGSCLVSAGGALAGGTSSSSSLFKHGITFIKMLFQRAV